VKCGKTGVRKDELQTLQIRHCNAEFIMREKEIVALRPTGRRLAMTKPTENYSMLADIFLDRMGWSVNNTTFEAIACNVPIVTFPGKLMRARHCSAILQMMGLTETIANTIDEYVEMASEMGRNA
jgi:predicted O-linked N-acetylglucosamine transferase (SPINDLY family)